MGFTAYPLHSGPESTRLLILKHLEGIVPPGIYEGFDVTPYSGANVMVSPGRLLTREMVNVQFDNNTMMTIPLGETKTFALAIHHEFGPGNLAPQLKVLDIAQTPPALLDNVLCEIDVDQNNTNASQLTYRPVPKTAIGLEGGQSEGLTPQEKGQLDFLSAIGGPIISTTLIYDQDDLVSSIVDQMQYLGTRTWSFIRDLDDEVESISVQVPSISFARTWSFIRDQDGRVTTVNQS